MGTVGTDWCMWYTCKISLHKNMIYFTVEMPTSMIYPTFWLHNRVPNRYEKEVHDSYFLRFGKNIDKNRPSSYLE